MHRRGRALTGQGKEKEGSVRAGTGTGKWQYRGREVLRLGTVQRQDRTGWGMKGQGQGMSGAGQDLWQVQHWMGQNKKGHLFKGKLRV